MSTENTQTTEKVQLTDAENKFLNLIIMLYQTAPSSNAFYRMAKIALQENNIKLS